MPQISASYASPGLRWGLLLEDHPAATVEFSLDNGTNLGIPDQFGGKGDFCVATITFPDHTDKPSVTAWKSVKDASKSDPDGWLVLCTKTLGRALKRCGYPDDLQDLKALVLWRQREAEIDAIRIGANALPSSLQGQTVELALEAAAVSDPEHTGEDEGDAPVIPYQVTAAQIETTPRSIEEIRGIINRLGSNSPKLTAWCKQQGIRVTKPANEGEAQVIIAEGLRMLRAPDGVDPSTGEVIEVDSVDPATLQELIDGLNDKERQLFTAFLSQQGITADVSQMTSSQLFDVAAWFEAP